jgi:CTP synthase
MAKFVFVTGGVVSSLGKGIAASSLGFLLKSRGLHVTLQKFDPYLNVDPGTMSPYQHGEVYVTDDGAETDLDLGHYERFTDVNLSRANNVTAGQVYETLIAKERKGEFLGRTVQVIPHVTDEIKRRVRTVADAPGVDVAIIEVGGTVGDIESLPFLEAIRQLRLELGRDATMFIHLTYVPYVKAAREIKTKPTQHSVKELREIGIQPDLLLCRSEVPLSPAIREKIALFCNVPKDYVIEALDVPSIYEVPLMLHANGLDRRVVETLRISAPEPELSGWEEMVAKIRGARRDVRIAICGKYTHLHDAYKSIIEAMTHAGVPNEARVVIEWIDAEEIERLGPGPLLSGMDGLLVPGGFGDRGTLGMVEAIRWARENAVPFFGICLGMQCATIEFARNVLHLEGANSSEFDPATPHAVIDLIPDQVQKTQKGGTMRLGAYDCRLERESLAQRAYGRETISERHRHRYEFSNPYREAFERSGMRAVGINPKEDLVEILELRGHPWFVAVQFHPELKSRPGNPHPLFREFVRAAVQHLAERAAPGSEVLARSG